MLVLGLTVGGFFVSRAHVNDAAPELPWIVLAGGLVLAGLAGALGVISARRAKAKPEVDRLFTRIDRNQQSGEPWDARRRPASAGPRPDRRRARRQPV
jgi:hypothetical protein